MNDRIHYLELEKMRDLIMIIIMQCESNIQKRFEKFIIDSKLYFNPKKTPLPL